MAEKRRLQEALTDRHHLKEHFKDIQSLLQSFFRKILKRHKRVPHEHANDLHQFQRRGFNHLSTVLFLLTLQPVGAYLNEDGLRYSRDVREHTFNLMSLVDATIHAVLRGSPRSTVLPPVEASSNAVATAADRRVGEAGVPPTAPTVTEAEAAPPVTPAVAEVPAASDGVVQQRPTTIDETPAVAVDYMTEQAAVFNESSTETSEANDGSSRWYSDSDSWASNGQPTTSSIVDSDGTPASALPSESDGSSSSTISDLSTTSSVSQPETVAVTTPAPTSEPVSL